MSRSIWQPVDDYAQAIGIDAAINAERLAAEAARVAYCKSIGVTYVALPVKLRG